MMGYGLPANLHNQISMRTHLKRKEVDDVLGGKEAWANVDKTDSESTNKRYDLGQFNYVFGLTI